MKQFPRDFDLSTSPTGSRLYVPPKSRDPIVAAERSTYSPGELVLHMQHGGLRFLRTVLSSVSDPEGLAYILPIVSTSLLNSAWHTSAEGQRTGPSGVGRRRLKLPTLYEWQDSEHLRQGMLVKMEAAEGLAANVIAAHAGNSPRAEQLRRQFGAAAGEAALMGACVEGLQEAYIPGSPNLAQLLARELSFGLNERRADIASAIGSAPTLAQFVDGDSDALVDLRRTAPATVFNAYAEIIAA